MKIVEEPVSGRHDELTGPYVVGQGAVCTAQHTDVILEAWKRVAGALAWIGVDGQAGGEAQRALFEPLDTQQFVAQRLLGRRRLTALSPAGPGRQKQAQGLPSSH
jgi:hypothetical protein